MRGGNGNIFIYSYLAQRVAQYCDAAGTLLVSDAIQGTEKMEKPHRVAITIVIGAVLTLLAPVIALQVDYLRYHWRLAPSDTHGDKAMVVSAHGLASQIGRDVLVAGGNAFDAAVAVNFALAVVYQQAGNIGGGGFMVYRLADGTDGALDFREKAPLAARRDMYLDADGNVIKDSSLRGHLAVGVPGTVAGMVVAHEKFGSLVWADLLTPAIKLARDGFVLSPKGARMFNRYQSDFSELNTHKPNVLQVGGWKAGDTARFPALADTLTRIAESDRNGFYKGPTAQMIVAEMDAGGGLITQADLDAYRPVWRAPIRFSYRGHEVISMPPPSSGGVALAQLLKGAEPYQVGRMGHNSAAHIHMMVELERRAYADRASYLGDPDFVDVPVDRLVSNAYIQARMAAIDPWQKTDSTEIREGRVDRIESVETTHVSIVDPAGNAVAMTTTLNGNFGSKVVVRGAGFFLNNEMDDFAIKPDHANQFGLLGNAQNAVAPGKRMLSSMTPTIVTKDGDLRLVVGTPGGATIITSVFQTIMNVVDFGMSAQQSVNARKAHSQWQPDMVMLERGALSVPTQIGLMRRGHRLYPWPFFKYELGRVEVVLIGADGGRHGAADYTRGEDDRASGF